MDPQAESGAGSVSVQARLPRVVKAKAIALGWPISLWPDVLADTVWWLGPQELRWGGGPGGHPLTDVELTCLLLITQIDHAFIPLASLSSFQTGIGRRSINQINFLALKAPTPEPQNKSSPAMSTKG